MTKSRVTARAKGATVRIRERPAGRSAPEDTIRYVETSALLAAALDGDVSAQRAVEGSGRVLTSSLTHAEAARAVVRSQASGRISPTQAQALTDALSTFARRCETIVVGEQLLGRAGRSFPVEPVRTLDAIHLATIEMLGAEPGSGTVVTRDKRVRENARAMGWSTE